MGIRFFCPNGHKLNVKSFLAGKKGVCPHCGARMRIPLESDPQLKKGSGGAATSGAAPEPDSADVSPSELAAGAEGGVAVGAASSASSTKTTAPTEAPRASGPAVASRDVGLPVGQAVSAPVPVAAAPRVADPIDEAPNAVWYVRPPTGGQYGPARGDVLRRWLGEGRVTADSYVWREGWADWLTASSVFPSLVVSGSSSAAVTLPAPGPASMAAAPLVAPAPVAAETSAAASASRTVAPRRRDSALSLLAIIVLAVMAIGLMVALYVVTRSN